MKSYQVLYIAKPNPSCSIEQLTHIGYYESLDKSPVVITVQEAITRISLNEHEFFVSTAQQACYLTIAGTVNGNQYLKTNSDSTQSDILLQLNELFEMPKISDEVYIVTSHTEQQHDIDLYDLLPSSSFKNLKPWGLFSNKKLVNLKVASIIGFLISVIK